MLKKSVTYRKQLELRGDCHAAPCAEALSLVKRMAEVKCDRSYKNGRKRKDIDQTVELVMHLGIDPRQADQMLRGSFSLPKGTGSVKRVIAFCDGDLIEAAKSAGATEAGADELVAKVAGGWAEFDVAIAHPSMMGKVGKLGRILGPQGKMPAPKAGTVTPDVVKAVTEFSAGKLEFRNDAGGNIHLPVGKASFSVDDLTENVEAAIAHISRLKPAAAKGTFMKRIAVCAARTPAVEIAQGT